MIGDADLVGVCDDCLRDLVLARAPLPLAMALVSRIASSPVSPGDCSIGAGAAFTVANEGVEDGALEEEPTEDCMAAKGAADNSVLRKADPYAGPGVRLITYSSYG